MFRTSRPVAKRALVTLAAASALTLTAPGVAYAADSNMSQALNAKRTVTVDPNATYTHHDIDAGDGDGYWEFGFDGGVFAFGDAEFAGSAAGITDTVIVGMARTESGAGYWLVGENGAVFSFGDAVFYGSAHDLNLNAPIVGMERAAGGEGYYLVAADGGVFSYGPDAHFAGSAANFHSDWMTNPVTSLVADPDGTGYWESALDGGVFAYSAPFYGSAHSSDPVFPTMQIEATEDGEGYWQVGLDGGVFAFGDAPYQGNDLAGNDDTYLPFGITRAGNGDGYYTWSITGEIHPHPEDGNDAPGHYGDAFDMLADLQGLIGGMEVTGHGAI